MTYLCVVKFKMREFEVLKHLDVCVPDQEVSVLLSPSILQRPVLTTLNTPALHHPETQLHISLAHHQPIKDMLLLGLLLCTQSKDVGK